MMTLDPESAPLDPVTTGPRRGAVRPALPRSWGVRGRRDGSRVLPSRLSRSAYFTVGFKVAPEAEASIERSAHLRQSWLSLSIGA